MITNLDELSQELTDDLSWRRREISSLLAAAQLASEGDRPILLRASMVMIYAHWEGFVKGAATRFLEYVSTKRLAYARLADGIFYLSVEADINRIANASRRESVPLLTSLLEKRQKQHRSRFADEVSTSNLRFDVLQDICAVCGLDSSAFSKDEGQYLDKKICDARNAVAHGRSSTVTYEQLLDRRDFVIGLIERFKTMVENSVATDAYQQVA